MKVKVRIWTFLWFVHGQRKEAGLPIRKMETLRVEERLIGAVRGYRPLQALVSFQPLVTDTSEQGSHRGDLVHDFRRVPIILACAEPVCDVLDDDPVRTASF